ncbi:DUF6691 family protein [Paraglaciecola aestuariivivens]
MKALVSLICGLLFGIGLTVSQMVDPNKVLNFLDIFGHWDPSLAFVMIGGIGVFMLGYNLVIKKSSAPIFAQEFDLPTNKKLDKSLIWGAALFGLGWGLAGICPGPAIANLSAAQPKIFVFILMMLLGMQIPGWFNQVKAKV